MFNRFKESVQEAKAKLVEAVDDGAGGGGDFQCPICMKKFNDPEILIKHHQQAHDESNKQIPAPISKSPPVVPTSPKPDERQITIDRLQNELKEENQKSITFKSEIEQLRSELEKLKGDNQQLTIEKEMLSSGLEQKSHESLETSEKLEEINTELLKTQVELTAERRKTDENQAQFDSEIEIIKSTLGRAELESTERQQRLDHAQQCLADEQERYKRLASNSSDNALTEAESKIEDLKSQLNQQHLSLVAETNKNTELSRLKLECEKMEKLNDHQIGLENANIRLLNEIGNCEQQCKLYKNTIDELNGRLASLTGDFDIYRRDNDTEKEQLKMQLREAISSGDLEHELNQTQEQLRIREQEILQLQATNQSNEIKISDLVSTGESSESMIREMIAEREIIEQSLSSTKENFSRIEADYKETRAQLKSKSDEFLAARQSITAQSEETKRFKAQAESWQYKYQNQASIAISIKNEKSELQAQNQTLRAQLQEAQLGQQAAKTEVETLGKSRQQLLSQSEKLVLAKATLDKEIRQFREREVQLKSQLTMVENLKQSAVQRESEKHEKLQFQLARSVEIKDQLNKLKADSKLAGEDLEREITARNELESKFETLEVDYGALLTNHKRLQSQLDNRASEFKEIEDQCSELSATNQKLSGSMSEAQSTINELGRRLAETQMAWENEKSRRWVDDESVDSCQQCNEQFTMLVRRHHCRKCGGIFCYKCSNFTLVLPSSSKPLRVCQPCQRG